VPERFVQVTAAGSPATLSEAKWEKLAEELSFSALKTVRASAAKWTGTVATLLAIFGIVTLVKGPADVSKVRGTWHWHLYGWHWFDMSVETQVFILLGLAVALAAFATLAAALAAYGLPRRTRFVGAEVRRQHRQEVRRSRRWLNASWMSTLLSLIALAGAVGLTWIYTPDDSTAPSQTIIFTNDGVAACGKLQPSTNKKTLVVLEKGKPTATPVDASEVTALGTLGSCPGK
jgi:hypothetical protein